jgi:lysophospholipase L1-like esterase
MANNHPAQPGVTVATVRRGRYRFGLLLCAALWCMFILMALRTSRYPLLMGRYSKEYAAMLGVAAAAALIVSIVQIPRVHAAIYGNRLAIFWTVFVCPLLALGVLEVSMRAWNLLGSEFYSDIRRYMNVLERDPNLYFKNPSDYRGVYQHVEIATNEIGMRDRPLQPHSASAVSLLILGDSVAFGWGVRVEDTFARQLETTLRFEGRPVRTLNASVPGYNTYQEWTFLRLNAQRLRPDRVLLLYVDNDIDAIDPARVHMGVRPNLWQDPQGVADYYLSQSRVYFMARHILPVLLGSRVSVSERRATPGWQDSMRCVSRIAAYCRTAGMPLAVIHYRMLPDPVSDAIEADLSSLARNDGFFSADTLPWFRGRNIRQLTNSFIDTHPNAAAHRILADGVARLLASETHRAVASQ